MDVKGKWSNCGFLANILVGWSHPARLFLPEEDEGDGEWVIAVLKMSDEQSFQHL